MTYFEKIKDRGGQVFNVKRFGAVNDARRITGVSITSGAAILTASSSMFSSSDIGKNIMVIGAGSSSNELFTTILSYQSATQVTLAANAITTASSKAGTIGTLTVTAISSAITAASAAGGGRVYLPNGGYFLNSTFTLPSNVSLIGQSKEGAVLYNNGPVVVGDNQELAHFKVYVNGRPGVDGITVKGTNKWIHDVHIVDFTNKGIEFAEDATYGGGAKNIYVERCNVECPGAYQTGGGSMLAQGGYSNIHIHDCYFGDNTNNGNFFEVITGDNETTFTSSDNAGLCFEGNAVLGSFGKDGYFGGRGCRIRNNRFKTSVQITCGAHGVAADDTPNNWLIEGNTFEGTVGGTDQRLLVAYSDQATQSIVEDILIKSNVFNKCSIFLQSDYRTSYIKRLSIIGNDFQTNGSSNIWCIAANYDLQMQALIITNNHFREWGTGAGAWASIQFEVNSTKTLTFSRSVISGNTFGPSGSQTVAIQTKGAGTMSGTIQVYGNDITGCTIDQPIAGVLKISDFSSGGSTQTFDVKAFGAKGDGSTNDTTAVQTAITALNAVGGGVLYFPRGTYNVTAAALVISSNTTVQGAGHGASQIVKTTNGILFDISGTSSANHTTMIVFKDLTLDGGAHTGALIRAYYSDRCRFNNINLHNNVDKAIDVVELWDSYFTQVHFNGASGADGTKPSMHIRNSAAASGFGFSTDSSNMIWFSQCDFEDFRDGALWIEQGTGGTGGPNGIFLNEVKLETGRVRGKFLYVDVNTIIFAAQHLYCYAGSFDSGFSTPVVGLDIRARAQSSLRDVWLGTGAAVISSGLHLESSDGQVVLDNYHYDGVAPTVSAIGWGTIGGTISVGQIGTTAGTLHSGTIPSTSLSTALTVLPMTTTQKNALTATNGMIVYDSTLNKIQGYQNGAWVSFV